MSTFWFVVISVAVGGWIGGVTNSLAIKMLFRPRKAVYLGRWKVPFTPGLIPKRREETAVQLGRIVSEYLLTGEGIREVLRSPEMFVRVERTLHNGWAGLSGNSSTLREVIVGQIGQEGLEQLEEGWKDARRDWIEQAVERLLSPSPWHEQLTKTWIPEWNIERVERLSLHLSNQLLGVAASFLASDKGEEMLKSGIQKMSGIGFLGSLAGMLMGDKLIEKLKQPLLEALEGEELKALVAKLLHEQIESVGNRPVGEWLSRIDQAAAKRWVDERVQSLFPAEAVLDKPLSEWLAPVRWKMTAWLPQIQGWLMKAAEKQVQPLLQALDIPKIVSSQVSRFPIEQFEEVMLEVSGKEFRMITWLGVFLGALIGALQAVVIRIFL